MKISFRPLRIRPENYLRSLLDVCEGLTIIRVDRKQRAVRIEVSGGAAPRDRDLSPGRDIGISRTGRSGYSRYPKLQRLCSERNYSISSTRFNRVFTANITSQLKNYRQHPEYKTAASGLRFPFTPRALSGWYVPSPDLPRKGLNGRNAEYSALLGSRLTRPVLKPDREEKGLGLTWRFA